MRLALQCGVWDVDKFLQQITKKQLNRWIAFYNIEPFGDEWRRSALTDCLIANSWGGSKADIEDFMPVKREHKKLTGEQQALAFRQMFQSKKKR